MRIGLAGDSLLHCYMDTGLLAESLLHCCLYYLTVATLQCLHRHSDSGVDSDDSVMSPWVDGHASHMLF